MLLQYLNFTLIALVFAAVWAPILIWILYKFDLVISHRLMRNKMNAEFIKIHGHKTGTPRSGGLIISVVVFLTALLLIPTSPLKTVFLIGWFAFTAYGLGDDLLTSASKLSDRARIVQDSFAWRLGKLGVLYLICLGMLLVAVNTLGINNITLAGDIIVAIDIFAAVILAFFIVLAIYAVEITDGADGLVTGKFLISYLVYSVVAVMTGYFEILPFIGLMLGSSLVYLYFNINPARVFMGGTGTLPIAFSLLLFTFVTDTLAVFVIMGIMFWIELFSSGSQMIAIRFFKHKIFRIAPIHHHFEATGWPEHKVVQRFWLAAMVFAILALWVFALGLQ